MGIFDNFDLSVKGIDFLSGFFFDVVDLLLLLVNGFKKEGFELILGFGNLSFELFGDGACGVGLSFLEVGVHAPHGCKDILIRGRNNSPRTIIGTRSARSTFHALVEIVCVFRLCIFAFSWRGPFAFI